LGGAYQEEKGRKPETEHCSAHEKAAFLPFFGRKADEEIGQKKGGIPKTDLKAEKY